MPRIRRAFGRIAFYYAMSSLWIVDPEVLITEVKARPLLYIKSLPDYANKSLKNDAWVDITKKFTENWDTLTTEEKNNRCKDIQAKWKHIRDNFRREHQAQKDDMTGQLEGRGTKEGSMTKWTKKRKKYRHYDQLSFLVPHIKDVNACGNYSTTRTVSENRITASLNIENTPSAPPIVPPNVQPIPARRKKIADPDEDTLFCLSLVQSLKKMDDDSKISTKIEILNTIRTFSNRSNYAHWQPSQPILIHRQTTPQKYSQATPTYTQDFNQVKADPTETISAYAQNIYQSSSGALPSKRIKIENHQCDTSSTVQPSRPHSAQGFLHIFNPVSPSPSSSTITSPLPNVSSSEDNN